MWLLTHGITLQCFKVTPYQLDEQLFLNIEQIIPTPEAEEFMIGMSAKETDQKSTEAELKNAHKLRLAFWEQTLEAMKHSSTTLFNNISPTKDHWLYAGSGVGGVPFTLIFSNKEVRVELTVARSETSENKFIFDQLHKNRTSIEAQFGHVLRWERLDNRKSCRVIYSQAFEGYDRDNWPEMIAWLVEHIVKLERAFKKPLTEISKELKQTSVETPKAEVQLSTVEETDVLA
jgi:hypothetical protein